MSERANRFATPLAAAIVGALASACGDSAATPDKSQFARGFELDADERRAFLALLESLTDERLLTDPRFADPW